VAQLGPAPHTDLTVALQGLARLAPAFSRPDFTFAVWEHPPSQQGIMTLPFCSLSSDASNFVKKTYDLGWITDFNWPRWSQMPEAETLLGDPQRVLEATPNQLANLLTTFMRRDRFYKSELNAAFGTGVLTAIVVRTSALFNLPCH